MWTGRQEVMAVTSNFRGHSDAIGLCHEAFKHTHTRMHTHTEAQHYSALNINHRGWQVICWGAPSFSLSFSFVSFPLFSLSLSLAVSGNCQGDCKVKDRFLPSIPPSWDVPSSLPWSLPCDGHFYHSQSLTSFHRSLFLPPSLPQPSNPFIHLFAGLSIRLFPPGITVQEVSP